MNVTEIRTVSNSMRLSLAPIPYYWTRSRVFDFYKQLESAPVSVVYLGETVCSKRRSMTLSDWIRIGERLVRVGKEVVLSTLTLVEAESELAAMRRIVNNGLFPVEANDVAALELYEGRNPLVAGPYLNVYNVATLGQLSDIGVTRWVVPAEMDRVSLAELQGERPTGLEIEVTGFGRIALAHSARCFTARALNLAKDQCGFSCKDYPDGMPLRTQDDQAFLVINGIQVQSAYTQNLVGELAGLREVGVDLLRVVPQPNGTVEVLRLIEDAVSGQADADEALQRLAGHMPQGPCDGYWQGRPGMTW